MKRFLAICLVLAIFSMLIGCTPDKQETGKTDPPVASLDQPNDTWISDTAGPASGEAGKPDGTMPAPNTEEIKTGTTEGNPPATAEPRTDSPEMLNTEPVPLSLDTLEDLDSETDVPDTEEPDEDVVDTYVIDIGDNAGVGGN